MAIYNPGVKFRRHRLLRNRGSKREVVALLSLTAMVDMFTVLVVFLLQNYKTDNVALQIPRDVTLPKAQMTKELKPSHIVTISPDAILLDKIEVAVFSDVKEQTEWMIKPLMIALQKAIKERKQELKLSAGTTLKKTVRQANNLKDSKSEGDLKEWGQVTVQAGKDVDFLTIKKIMFTVTEAGASQINFAVITKKSTEGG